MGWECHDVMIWYNAHTNIEGIHGINDCFVESRPAFSEDHVPLSSKLPSKLFDSCLVV
jgi:hypothetical protein